MNFMANIAGAQECNNEDEEGRSDIESDRENQAAIPQLKYALSTTVDHIAAVAMKSTKRYAHEEVNECTVTSERSVFSQVANSNVIPTFHGFRWYRYFVA